MRSLVYIAALAPDENETVADVFYRADPHPEAPHLAPDADGFIWMPEEGFGSGGSSQGLAGRGRDYGGRTAADRPEVHSGEGSCACVENEAIVVPYCRRRSHD